VSVRRDDEANAALPSGPEPPRGQVEPFGVAVDLHGGAAGRHRVEDFFDAALDGWPREDEAPERVAQILKTGSSWPARGAASSGWRPCGAAVDAGDDHVEALQDGVWIVEAAIGQDVRLGAAQEPYRDGFLDPRDLLPLRLEPIDGETARAYAADIE